MRDSSKTRYVLPSAPHLYARDWLVIDLPPSPTSPTTLDSEDSGHPRSGAG